MTRRFLHLCLTVMTAGVIGAASPCVFADTQSPATARSEYARALDKLIEDMEAAALAHDPIAAGLEGDAQAARRLPDLSPAAMSQQAKERAVFTARYNALPRAGFTGEDKLNYDLLGYVLSRDALIGGIDDGRIPFRNDSGFFSNLSYVARLTRFDKPDDYAAYTDRLSELPRWFAQHIDNMKRGIQDGYTAPAEIMPGVIQAIEDLTAIASEDHPLAAPFMDVNADLPEPLRAEIQQKGLAMMESAVMPAYRNLLNFIETEYLPKARPGIGLSTLSGGKSDYEALTKYFTTLDITPQEVHAIGEREVSRIRARMDDIIKEVNFDGTFKEFLNFLRTDPQFYAATRKDLLKEAAYIAKRADEKMPEYFRTLPRLSYGVIPVPESLEKNYTTGRYFGGNAKQGKAGNYVVNTYNLPNRPLYNLPALTLHEGVPGHHHQISLAAEQDNVPKFRRDLYPHAFGEGWGLYAEKLGEEMGIYQTPYEQFGRLTYEMWRACRLVMDTGMHYMGWTRQRAESCLYENSALAPHNIRTETDRYIAWPGQALAYKMGELKLVELRERAQRALGPKFDIRDFHDAVLVNGAMPLGILEIRINEWINSVKNR